jgi:hypothetical protein
VHTCRNVGMQECRLGWFGMCIEKATCIHRITQAVTTIICMPIYAFVHRCGGVRDALCGHALPHSTRRVTPTTHNQSNRRHAVFPLTSVRCFFRAFVFVFVFVCSTVPRTEHTAMHIHAQHHTTCIHKPGGHTLHAYRTCKHTQAVHYSCIATDTMLRTWPGCPRVSGSMVSVNTKQFNKRFNFEQYTNTDREQDKPQTNSITHTLNVGRLFASSSHEVRMALSYRSCAVCMYV